MAVRTRFELAVSSVTGRYVNTLHHRTILARNNKPLPTEYKALRYTQRIRTVSLIIPLSLYLTHSFGFADAYLTEAASPAVV